MKFQAISKRAWFVLLSVYSVFQLAFFTLISLWVLENRFGKEKVSEVIEKPILEPQVLEPEDSLPRCISMEPPKIVLAAEKTFHFTDEEKRIVWLKSFEKGKIPDHFYFWEVDKSGRVVWQKRVKSFWNVHDGRVFCTHIPGEGNSLPDFRILYKGLVKNPSPNLEPLILPNKK